MRPAAKSELPAAVELYQSCWKNERLARCPHWDEQNEKAERAFRMTCFQTYGVHIINVNQQDIGLLAVHVTDSEIWARDLCLMPDYREQGLGHDIITLLKEQAIAANVSIKLEVDKNNLRAKKLYKAAEFSQVAETISNITMRWWPPALLQL